ncbi:hypothetical protein ABZ135_09700 [Streptomyces sp. NPDC006339]|uniref:hypothetical protein n=1 Tax=Streptomyces sp. NPDC006339 TaxID=3156755 RepID=UPI0033A48EED
MRTTRVTAVLAVALLAGLTACTSGAEPSRQAEPTAVVSVDTVPTATTAPPEQPAAGGGMPDLIGGSVAGAYGQLSGSMRFEDISGKGRMVPVQSSAAADWKICTQDPAPGAAVTGTIVLGAVMKNETC